MSEQPSPLTDEQRAFVQSKMAVYHWVAHRLTSYWDRRLTYDEALSEVCWVAVKCIGAWWSNRTANWPGYMLHCARNWFITGNRNARIRRAMPLIDNIPAKVQSSDDADAVEAFTAILPRSWRSDFQAMASGKKIEKKRAKKIERKVREYVNSI